MPNASYTNRMSLTAARRIVEAIEALPDNPKHSEVHVKNGRVLGPGEHRLTPRTAVLQDEDGSVRIIFADDGWCRGKIVAQNATVER